MKKFSFSDIKIDDPESFSSVLKKGEMFESFNFLVYALLDENLQSLKFGMIAGKKIGSAVKRNRIKRLVREFFRLNKYRIKEGIFVIKPKKNCNIKDYNDVKKEFEFLFNKNNLFKNNKIIMD